MTVLSELSEKETEALSALKSGLLSDKISLRKLKQVLEVVELFKYDNFIEHYKGILNIESS